MADPEGNIGELLHSPSAAFMKLVDCDHLNDFDVVCEYISEHAAEVSYSSGRPVNLLNVLLIVFFPTLISGYVALLG